MQYAVAAAAAGGVQGQKGLGCHARELRPYRNGESIKGLLFWFWQGSKELALYKDQWFENRF